jgi:hypothetical protein
MKNNRLLNKKTAGLGLKKKEAISHLFFKKYESKYT